MIVKESTGRKARLKGSVDSRELLMGALCALSLGLALLAAVCGALWAAGRQSAILPFVLLTAGAGACAISDALLERRARRELTLLAARAIAVESLTDAVLLEYDPETDVLSESIRKNQKAVFYQTGEFLKKEKYRTILEPESWQRLLSALDGALYCGKTFNEEWRIDLGGGLEWYSVRVEPFAPRREKPHARMCAINVNRIVSERNAALHMAQYDFMTGVLRRDTFLARASRKLRALPAGRECSLIYIDLDNFKSINDTNGHTSGDRAIASVGAALLRVFAPEDVVGRLGGDEFAVFLSDAGRAVSSKRLWQLASVLAGHELRFSAGVCIGEKGAKTPPLSDIVPAADRAMYLAKQRGSGGCEFVNM